MGRARYAKGYIVLTETKLWQANWYVYVKDPKTGVEKRQHRTRIVGSKATMARYQAQEELLKISRPIAAVDGRVDETTLGGFMLKRWKPMHEGGWREESTRATNLQLLDIIRERFGETLLTKLDKVELQEWLTQIARTRSKSAVLHLRIFLKSICAEAVEQDYLHKDPARKLIIPKTRAVDKTSLTWDELWQVFEALPGERDQLILGLETTTGIRPSELFVLKRGSWDGSIFTIRETVYRGVVRPYGKTDGSMTTINVPPDLAAKLTAWLEKLEDTRPNAYIFPNSKGGFISKENYLRWVLYPVRDSLGLKKLNFQVLRRTFSTLAQDHGNVTDIQRQMRHTKPDMTAGVYMQPISERVAEMTAALYQRLVAKTSGKIQ